MIKRMVTEIYEQLYTNIFDDVGDMDKFLERHTLSKSLKNK